MEIDMRTEREYIEKRRLTMMDEQGIKYWTCEEVGELIRCKDCKYYGEELCWNVFGRCVTVSDMDYCSSGERKEAEIL